MTTQELKAAETKECGLCKCTIERGTLDNYHWNRSKFCSQRCSALYRGVLIGGWRHDKKECKVCGVPFGPRPGITKGCWRRLKCCSDDCAKKAQTGRRPAKEPRIPAYRFQRVEINPADCKTVGQRLRFLRLSQSPEGIKKPIGTCEMSRIAKVGHSTLERIESDDPSAPQKSIERLCAALRFRPDWLKWSEKKWTRVISASRLTATEAIKTKTES